MLTALVPCAGHTNSDSADGPCCRGLIICGEKDPKETITVRYAQCCNGGDTGGCVDVAGGRDLQAEQA